MIKDVLAIVEGATELDAAVATALAFAELHEASIAFHVLDAQRILAAAFDPLQQFRVDEERVDQNQRHVDRVHVLAARTKVPVEVKGICDEPTVLFASSNAAARTSDIVLVGPRSMWSDDYNRRKIVESVLLGSGCPVLLYPGGWRPRPFGHAVLAWNDSVESSRAARILLDVLPQAAKVEVATVDHVVPEQSALHAPAGAIADHLARHGCNMWVTNLDSSGESTVSTLCDFSIEAGANLLAIGAYSHSRLREDLFGGVTGSLISHQRLPILLVH